MIINNETKVFVGKRIDNKSNAWQMPQGGIDINESEQEAALREMKEEVGTNDVEIIAASRNLYKYDLPEYLVPKLWNGKYCGQKQRWFLLKYLNKDEAIDLNYSSHPEFSQWKWVDMEELSEIIIPFKRDLYLSIIEEFRDYIISMKYKNV